MSAEDLSEADPDEDRQLKVTVPARMLIRLRSQKILSGDTFSKQVQEALDQYLSEMDV